MEGPLELVQAEVIMKKTALIAAVALLVCGCTPRLSWECYKMDAHRTGVNPVVGDNVSEALGTLTADGKYVSPNGNEYDGTVAEVAGIMLEVQPGMAYLKECVGYCPEGMVKSFPECALSNWSADAVRAGVAQITGRKVDVGITNFGGIRIEMPKGDVLIDDIVSMFPFRNYLSYVALKGTDLRALFEQFAAEGPQAISGAKLVISDGKLESAEVGGKPLDDNAVYGVGTSDFLLDGGDNLFVARNARELIISNVQVKEFVVDYVRDLTAKGIAIDAENEGRIVVK